MATYYIAASGGVDSAGRGTLLLPWATLAYAYTNTIAGDTIYFLPGTHTWLNQTMLNRTLQGAGATSIVSAGSYTAEKYWAMSGVILNDMVFTYNGLVASVYSMFQNGVTGAGYSIFTFNRCIFHDLVLTHGGSGAWAHGLFGGTCQVAGGGSNAGDIFLTLNSCLLYDIRANAAYSGARIFGLYGGDGPAATLGQLIVNNTTFCFTATGTSKITILVHALATYYSSVIFKNCIVYNGGGGVLTWYSGTLTPTATYTCSYLTTGAPSGTGNITSDPLFIDIANANFRLRPGSPCLETGTII